MVAMQRVKVYRLNAEGQWDDKGTGHVSVEVMEQSNAVGLVVISEEEGSQETRTLLIHRISKEGQYTRQSDDTIISWTDAEIGTDIALSFAEAQGCSYIWDQIQEVQGKSHHASSPGAGATANGEAGGGRKRMVDEFEQVSASIEAGEFQDSTSSGPVDLPPPERGRLGDIAQVLSELAPFQRETAGHQMQARGYIRKLLDIFNRCEDLEDAEGLRHMYMITRGAIMLGDFGVLEVLMSEENVMDTVGALEYEPDLPITPKHREFLRDKVVFKEVVPIRDASLRAKIHQTYRMGYVKDVVLPRSLDDNGFTALSSLMLLNNVEVVTSLQQDSTFLQELFVRLRASRPGQEEWADLVAFLQELCSLVKHLQANQRSQLLQKLTSLGLFEVMSQVLKSGKPELRMRATDILLSCTQHDPQPLRRFLKDQPNSTLFALLMKTLLESDGTGLQEQTAEVLRMLLDTETLDSAPEKDDFLELFYNRYMSHLVQGISNALGVPFDETPTSQPAAAAAPKAAPGISKAALPTPAAAGAQPASAQLPASNPESATPLSSTPSASTSDQAVGANPRSADPNSSNGNASAGVAVPGTSAAAAETPTPASTGAEQSAEQMDTESHPGQDPGGGGSDMTAASQSAATSTADLGQQAHSGAIGPSNAAASIRPSTLAAEAGRPSADAVGSSSGTSPSAAITPAAGGQAPAAPASSAVGQSQPTPSSAPSALPESAPQSTANARAAAVAATAAEPVSNPAAASSEASQKQAGDVPAVSSAAAAVDGTGKAAAKPKQRLQRLGQASTVGLIIDMLCFCVQHHGYRIKYYVLRNNVVDVVLKLLWCREKWLVVSAIRFLRSCIALKDPFYYRYLVRNNHFAPVVDRFLDNGARYNLLDSAVLELFEFIRKENIKDLMEHLMQTFWPQLQGVTHAKTFQQMHSKYEQGQERVPGREGEAAAASEAALAAARRRRDARAMDKDEEDYFNEDDNEEEGSGGARPQQANGILHTSRPAASLIGPLVDYDNDDDEGDDGFLGSKRQLQQQQQQAAGAPNKRFRITDTPSRGRGFQNQLAHNTLRQGGLWRR